MSARVFRIASIAVVVFALLAGSASALSRNARISTAGLGPVKIGMTERQVERKAKRSIRLREGAAGAACRTARLGSKDFLLFSGKRLARIYVYSQRYATRSGVRVGDSEQKVIDTYGDEVERTAHEYTMGSYFKIEDGNRKVVFETDGAKVTSISSGRKPEIDYIEGCS